MEPYLTFDVISVMYLTFDVTDDVTMAIATALAVTLRDAIDSLSGGPSMGYREHHVNVDIGTRCHLALITVLENSTMPMLPSVGRL